MAQPKLLMVEVVYALPQVQTVLSLSVPLGTTAQQAIEQSGILKTFPDINLGQQALGIFSEKISLDRVLEAGDRVEIYRPLPLDPKVSRLKRVEEARIKAARIASQPKKKPPKGGPHS